MHDWTITLVSGLGILSLVILRATSGRLLRPLWNDLPDIAVATVLWLSMTLLTQRPVSAALLWTVLAAGLLLSDHTKRKVLREPVVFADASELLLVFTHPRFYLPYVHPVVFYGIGSVLIVATGLLFSIEPPIMPGKGVLCHMVGALLLIVPIGAYFWRPSLNVMAMMVRKLKLSGDPVEDARKLGMLGSFAAYTVCSRQERPARQAACAFGALTVPPDRPPIVLVQAESFFDIGRLDPTLPCPLVEYQACVAQAVCHGRLNVGSWGANTTRSEFAAISGVALSELGLDRFNPYYSFVRKPLDTLARRMQHEGYLTVCVHPYDRRFYSRHKVMPNLGFDHFIGGEAFESAHGQLVPDEILGAWINDFIGRQTQPVFVFAITVANHGPYPVETATTNAFSPLVGGYLDSLMGTDRMIGQLTRSRWLNENNGILALYGDHQPSLPILVDDGAHIGTSTDYFILDRSLPPGPRHDIRVDQLGHEIACCLARRAIASAPGWTCNNSVPVD